MTVRTNKPNPGPSTLSIWGGEKEQELYQRSTQVPVVHSISYGYKDIETWHKVALGEASDHIYSRNTNPTVEIFEQKVKVLEGAHSGQERLSPATPSTDPYVTHSVIRFLSNQCLGTLTYDYTPNMQAISHERCAVLVMGNAQ